MHRHIWQKPKEGDIFKFCKCGKRKKVAKSASKIRKELMDKAWDLCRKIVHRRDGDGCQVQIHHPHLNLSHSREYHVDHFQPRGIHALFFEISNLTKICSHCNFLKSNGSNQSGLIVHAVQDIVFKREGEEKFNYIMDMANKNPIVEGWKREWWLKEVIAGLENHLQTMQGIS